MSSETEVITAQKLDEMPFVLIISLGALFRGAKMHSIVTKRCEWIRSERGIHVYHGCDHCMIVCLCWTIVRFENDENHKPNERKHKPFHLVKWHFVCRWFNLLYRSHKLNHIKIRDRKKWSDTKYWIRAQLDRAQLVQANYVLSNMNEQHLLNGCGYFWRTVSNLIPFLWKCAISLLNECFVWSVECMLASVTVRCPKICRISSCVWTARFLRICLFPS